MLLKKGDGFEYILAMKRTKQYLSINVYYAYLGVARFHSYLHMGNKLTTSKLQKYKGWLCLVVST
jgi:hypothetical protein